MFLADHDIQHTLERVQAAFPSFTQWAYTNASDDERSLDGFSLWGQWVLHPEETMARHFFARLATPIDPATELGDTGVSGRGQLALVGRVTTGIGLACFLMLLVSASGQDRIIVFLYALVTTLTGLAFVAAGRAPKRASENEAALSAAAED